MRRGLSREELRSRRGARSDKFVATDLICGGLHDRIHKYSISVTSYLCEGTRRSNYYLGRKDR